MFHTGAVTIWLPGPKKTILAGNLVFTLREQEAGIVGMEVALGTEIVKRHTGFFVFAQEFAFFPSCSNIGLDQVPIHHFTLQVVLEAGDV